MKSNIVTRVVFDEDNNKAYLSVEGKVENATNEEKINLRNTLTKAFGFILGVEGEISKESSEITNDFQATKGIEVPGFIKPSNNEDNLSDVMDAKDKKADTKPVEKKEHKEETVSHENKEDKDPVIGFGKYSKLTAKQAIEKDGDEAVRYLKDFLIGILKQRVERGEANAQEKVDSVNKALNQIGSKGNENNDSLFDKLNKELIEREKAEDDPNLDTINTLCDSYGTTYKAIVETKDLRMLQIIHDEFLSVADGK